MAMNQGNRRKSKDNSRQGSGRDNSSTQEKREASGRRNQEAQQERQGNGGSRGGRGPSSRSGRNS